MPLPLMLFKLLWARDFLKFEKKEKEKEIYLTSKFVFLTLCTVRHRQNETGQSE